MEQLMQSVNFHLAKNKKVKDIELDILPQLLNLDDDKEAESLISQF